jgi:uracil-DNA glycosylase family 4
MRIIPPEGNLSSNIAIVGEAPGYEEDKIGKPFIGVSGQLLFSILNGLGVVRQDCYITNVIKERPPGNDISKFITFRGQSAYPTKEYLEYEAYLQNELNSFTGNIIVAVGAISLYALTHRLHITKQRGSILQAYNGKKCIPIIHPAAALRQYIWTHLIRYDLKRVIDESKFPEIRLPARNLHIRPSYGDIINFLTRCKAQTRIAFDIEVMNDEVSCISFALSPSEVISIPFIAGGHDYMSVEQEGQVWLLIASILEDTGIEKVGQNICFDSTFLFRKLGIRTSNMHDSMIAQAIMFPDFPKGLDYICSIYTKEPYYKDEGKKWFKMGGSEDDFWVYNAKDSAVCLEALEVLNAELDKIGNTGTYQRQVRLVEPLIYLQERGTAVDMEGLRQASQDAGKKIEELTEQLHQITGQPINPNSPAQLKDYFYVTKKEKPYVNRKTGGQSVDKDALKRLSRKGYKEASLLLDIRHYAKLKGTYLDVTLDKDNRLRCAFNPVGTTSGRLSSSETIFGTGTNLQNLPPEFKKFLRADEDYLIFNCDLSQAENRVVAYIAPEPNMIMAFEKGTDIHRQTAGLIFGKRMEDISDEEGSSTIGGGLFSERFWGKKANHGLNYDLGYKTFAFYYEIPEAESKFIVDRYHLAYPGIRQYHAWVRTQLSKDRTLTNAFGRKRLFLERWGDELFKESYSFIPQSTVADKLNQDGLAFVYYNQQWFRPIELLNQVHDSLVFQINYKQFTYIQMADCLLRLKASLESPINWRGTQFSIPADFEVGFSLDKKALRKVPKDEFESAGRLAGFLSSIRG